MTKKFVSKSGVHVSGHFRENLIIDRYDPLFVGMRSKKRLQMRSENSEDAVTWNVFRTLRQINPNHWLPELAKIGLKGKNQLSTEDLAVFIWKDVEPPTSLLSEGDEGISEIDVVIETPTWVWFIEAKYRSDISPGTTTRPLRDQVLRNIDVGSYYAGVRDFHFSLLINSRGSSKKGVNAINKYADKTILRDSLPHRKDGLKNIRDITLITWKDLYDVLVRTRDQAILSAEHDYADRATTWMESSKLKISS